MLAFPVSPDGSCTSAEPKPEAIRGLILHGGAEEGPVPNRDADASPWQCPGLPLVALAPYRLSPPSTPACQALGPRRAEKHVHVRHGVKWPRAQGNAGQPCIQVTQ